MIIARYQKKKKIKMVNYLKRFNANSRIILFLTLNSLFPTGRVQFIRRLQQQLRRYNIYDFS